MERIQFPFSAIVGQELMKTALLLNVIDPSIGGVLIKGQRGTAKSTGVRALIDLLPEIRVVQHCPFQCDPDDSIENLCPFCREKYLSGDELPVEVRSVRLVNLPIGTTEDRLLGTIDIEKAIKEGKKAFEPGLLAEAHRGILYVDEVNLLNDQIVDLLLDVAASGVNIVEREGIRFSHASRFVLVGTMNPEEGELRPQLLDRFGLSVTVEASNNVQERLEIIKRHLEFEKDPTGFRKKWENENSLLRGVLEKARSAVAHIQIPEDMFELAAQLAIAMETDGHRAEITIIKAARAHAALKGKSLVDRSDILIAAKLSLAHRVKKNPLEKAELDEAKLEKVVSDFLEKREIQEEKKSWEVVYKNENLKQKNETFSNPLPFYISHICQSMKQLNEVKIPFYKLQLGNHSGKRFPLNTDDKSGVTSGVRFPRMDEQQFDLSVVGTLRAAAPYQKYRGMNGRVIIKNSDFRFRKRLRKTGLTIVLVIDSSASMRINDKMSKTKGILNCLIRDLYVKRDRLGIITFRNQNAYVLLPITNNMRDAVSKIEVLPVGGKTPLAKGLDLAVNLLKQEKFKNPESMPVIMLFSDGRPNVSCFGEDPVDETFALAKKIRKEKIQAIFVDTELDPMAMGYGYLIAQRMNAIYLPMDRLISQ